MRYVVFAAGFALTESLLLCACTTASETVPRAAIQASSAPESAPVSGPAIAAKDGTSEKKICKRMPVMGSNFPKTVCSTAAEWAAMDEATRASVDAYDKDRKQGNTQGSFENQ